MRLADLCIDNFIEMRDKVGSWLFRMRKRFAILLNKLFPRWYVPLYTMIEFTRIPYAGGAAAGPAAGLDCARGRVACSRLFVASRDVRWRMSHASRPARLLLWRDKADS